MRKTVNISGGSHTLEWRYTKDLDTNLGSDCGWVDQVTFGAAEGEGEGEDTIQPVLTLIGDAHVTIDCLGTYWDDGATAYDDVDGDISAWVETYEDVDTSVPGSYEISYNVADSSGNWAYPVWRTVEVLDDCTVPTSDDAAQQLRDSFGTTDWDGSGDLGFDEAQAVVPGLNLEVFNQLDTDGNGGLTLDELGGSPAGLRGCFDCMKAGPRSLKDCMADWLLLGLSLILVVSWGSARRNGR